jgi:eukaryotic-like serine/threonine-protein kinase
VLLDLVSLCTSTREATDEAWRALRARADAASVEQELIESREMSALALLRSGHADEAREQLAEALRLAEKIPNVMQRRLDRDQTLVAAAADGAPVARLG